MGRHRLAGQLQRVTEVVSKVIVAGLAQEHVNWGRGSRTVCMGNGEMETWGLGVWKHGVWVYGNMGYGCMETWRNWV